MQLTWHPYRYYPYERSLALREIQSMLGPAAVQEDEKGIYVDQPRRPNAVTRLVYFAAATDKSGKPIETQQRLLERINGSESNRQSTRYSAHGLHEYKGRFNPQVAKAILNIFGATPKHVVLDPFCGSGTSLVECAHLGIRAVGTDMNPLAVYLANAKLKSLGIPAATLKRDAAAALARAKRSRAIQHPETERNAYLRSWFPPDVLSEIEKLRLAIESLEADTVEVLLAVASNLLREYSLQDPHDLRIRRRKTPLPEDSFLTAFERAANAYCDRMRDAQATLGVLAERCRAIHTDCRRLPHDIPRAFDMALTSPPYATALPYIDTQRLSLVWLNLLQPSKIMDLEARLVGSREIRGESRKNLLLGMESNVASLPESEHAFCLRLQKALSRRDGFRRQAVPRLLYRYFSGMAEAFTAVRQRMKPHAPFALIVGSNHTILGGTRFDIDTPRHLVNIAISRGWQHVETIPLQTYQRFGLHMNNATTSEALVVLRA